MEAEKNMNPQQFLSRSNFRGFIVFGGDWIILFGIIAIGLQFDNILVYIVIVWLVGLKQFSVGEGLIHEAVHYNLFKNRKLNDFIGYFCSAPFLISFQDYREEHMLHHSRAGTPDDPIFEDYRIYGFMKEKKNLFWLWFIKPVIGYGGFFFLKDGSCFVSFKETIKVLPFWIPIFALFAYLGKIDILLLYWFVPLLWSFASFLYWSEVEDHFNTRHGTRSNLSRFSNILVNHNSGYHYVHHDYPYIPWYNLYKAHKELWPRETDVTYGFFDTYRRIKEKL